MYSDVAGLLYRAM